ncbi:interferon-induced protein 44-like [Clarias gariepinus]|uniref:interferon-induced protein 44-like isoform X2 n=1 Tax=Clarias gariepinus TaxID=13013 RepID=UPI00234E1571|nr:interferon-induced protein 44-like isoform X2 [Clarias gariepinus]
MAASGMEDNVCQMLRYIKKFQPATAESRKVNILLHGPIGAGKSSFINSINTAIQGKNTARALVDASSGNSQSYTLTFNNYHMKKAGTRSYYPFVFTDIMGLEPENTQGIQPKDIKNILKGHVKDGYTFNPVKPIGKDDPRFYRSDPGLRNRVHCLVSALPADKISLISDEVIQKMRDVRKTARDLGIPQVVVMSMVDKACPLVNQNLSKIYTSKRIKEKMKECSDRLGVPMNCIYPVQNYHEQVANDMDMDILILMAVTDIINFANNYVEDQVYKANQDDE